MQRWEPSSPWRALFAQGAEPDDAAVLAVLAPLRKALAATDDGGAQRRQVSFARALLDLELPAARISQLISDHNDGLYREAIGRALADMRAQGWGEPPVDFCVLVLGSGGRHESLLGPDQDNALILADYPDSRHNAVDAWFLELSLRFTQRLDALGIPLCKGFAMASYPLWRKPLSAWCEQMSLWMRRRTTHLVMVSNILLDFSPVYGDGQLAQSLRRHILSLVPRAGLFLDEMARLLVDDNPVALDRLGRLAGDGQDAPHARSVNFKRQGLLPLQSTVRMLALVAGLSEVDTRSRLQALTAAGVLPPDLGAALMAAMDRLQGRVLRAQLAAVAAGRPADGWVDLASLGVWEREQLRQDMLAVRRAQRLAQGASRR